MDAERYTYPFTAIVGQEQMKLALVLASIQPAIGGVLIQGERGTAKTTAVRALPGVLAEGTRVIELPLNATEDNVVGTLNVGSLMKTGEREFVPGVLAEADGNILYVDEINLLEDHIVDLLLDAAATGTCRIEREGVSRTYSARFVLVGTMNPEEGTLRPQLLDRFGLSVKVTGSLSSEDRLVLVDRHIDFEEDPAAFCDRFASEEKELADRISQAREHYAHVAFPKRIAAFSAGVCNELAVDGYRADIVMMRTARALAAWESRDSVTEDDVLRSARLALPHRMKHLPFEEVTLSETVLEKAVDALHERNDMQDSSSEPDSAPATEAPSTATVPEGPDVSKKH